MQGSYERVRKVMNGEKPDRMGYSTCLPMMRGWRIFAVEATLPVAVNGPQPITFFDYRTRSVFPHTYLPTRP